MGSVIERHGYTLVDGFIHFDDRPSSFDAADRLAGRRLDRRKNYAIVDGTVNEQAGWSEACSGCYEGWDSFHSKGTGCSECGFTGRRRHRCWVPLPDPSNV